jgi:hypothetical protein
MFCFKGALVINLSSSNENINAVPDFTRLLYHLITFYSSKKVQEVAYLRRSHHTEHYWRQQRSSDPESSHDRQ